MATFRLRHFSDPQTLRAIAPRRLVRFLEPFRTFFTSRDYQLPTEEEAETEGPECVNYQAIVNIFMAPDQGTPRELLDGLYLVDEMSTPEAMDALLVAADAADLTLDPDMDHSPADVAVQVWLLDSDILERKHAEQFLLRPKSFEYFQASSDAAPAFIPPSSAVRKQLERELDDWFEHKKRGRNSRVFIFARNNEVAFLIRHGEPFKREESQEGAEVSSVCYRPIKYDVAMYDRQLGELRINAQLAGEKKLYCQKLGEHLFGDRDCFPGKKKYTLEPLREYGADALACFDIEGIEWITLTEIEFHYGGTHNAREVKKADDIFADLDDRGRQLPAGGRITKAVFKVKFEDSKTPRSVKIKPSNVAQYTRDTDAALVEQWLTLRGFMVSKAPSEHEPREEVLVGT
jgi:hypothetical protein